MHKYYLFKKTNRLHRVPGALGGLEDSEDLEKGCNLVRVGVYFDQILAIKLLIIFICFIVHYTQNLSL